VVCWQSLAALGVGGSRKADSQWMGLKKVDRSPALPVHLRAFKRTEAQILLYFDPGTFVIVRRFYSHVGRKHMGADVYL